MIYPIVGYGHPSLRNVSTEVEKGTNLNELIGGMFETMNLASGVGLAAPQIGKNIRLFVVDVTPYKEENMKFPIYKTAVINPEIIELSGEEEYYQEGCLSIPDVRVEVLRKPKVHIKFYDQDWIPHILEADGMLSRVIQHEYDHLEGKLHIDYASPLKKKMMNSKLDNIEKGKVKVDYHMKFA